MSIKARWINTWRFAFTTMQCHLEAGHDKLPLVIPVLFYHGEQSPYPFSMKWLDEFAEPEVARVLYDGALSLVDVTVLYRNVGEK